MTSKGITRLLKSIHHIPNITAMEKRDYYEVLGIAKTATTQEIKKAYRTLAKQFHPDRNSSPDAETKFKEVQEAYETLGDPEKRKAYDQFGHAGTQGFSGFGNNNGYAGGFSYEDLGDVFSQFFGQDFGGFGDFSFGQTRHKRSRTYPGEDLQISITIDFFEAIFGTERKIKYKRKGVCVECNGSGAESVSDKITCSRCHGKGTVIQIQQTFIGRMQTQTVCPECNGAGEIIKRPCKACKGKGNNDVEDLFTIKIPHGIPDNVTLKFRNRGNAGSNGGQSGDLNVSIEITPHEYFERRGNDIYVQQSIDPIVATLGGEISVMTVHGDLAMKVPPGTQPGTVFKLSGKGGPQFKGNKNGDQYVKINVQIPTSLNSKQRSLWQDLKEVS